MSVRQTAHDVEIGEPAGEEEDGFVADSRGGLGEMVQAAFCYYELSGDLDVLLPGDADGEGVGRDDLERCEHYGCC